MADVMELRDRIAEVLADDGWEGHSEPLTRADLESIADALLPLIRGAKEGVWQEGWNQGFRDMQAARYTDGYMEVTPTPNPYRAGQEANHE